MGRLLVCLAIVGLTVGCGGGETGPKTYPVTGKLTVGGKPLQDVNVQLIPLDPAQPGAAGKTDASGAFSVVSNNGSSGAVAGKYKVVLQQAQAMSMAAAQYAGSGGPPKPAATAYPAEYSAAATTPKEIEVTNQAVTLDLAL